MSTTNRLSSLDTARRRRRARGAAMVEALAAIPFFIIIFGSTIYMGSIYNRQLRTMANSRRDAWAEAVRNCPASSTEIPTEVGADVVLEDGENAIGSELCDTAFKEATVIAEGTAGVRGALGDPTKTVRSQSTLLCNEKPVAGNFNQGIEYLWNRYKEFGLPVATLPPDPIYTEEPYVYPFDLYDPINPYY
jgi:hypothetical protein